MRPSRLLQCTWLSLSLHAVRIRGPMVSWRPRIKTFPGFLHPGEAEQLRRLVAHRMTNASARVQGNDEPDRTLRRSSAVFMNTYEDADPVVRRIKARVAELIMHPATHFEKTQIQVYEKGEEERVLARTSRQRMRERERESMWCTTH